MVQHGEGWAELDTRQALNGPPCTGAWSIGSYPSGLTQDNTLGKDLALGRGKWWDRKKNKNWESGCTKRFLFIFAIVFPPWLGFYSLLLACKSKDRPFELRLLYLRHLL
jgi:hypothetical protein